MPILHLRTGIEIRYSHHWCEDLECQLVRRVDWIMYVWYIT